MKKTEEERLPALLGRFAERLVVVRCCPATIIAAPVAVVRYTQHLCPQWAAALAFYSLMGLVPVLIAVFALGKGVGLHRELTPYVAKTVGAGSPAVTEQIVRFIDRTETRAIGIASAIAAILAAFGILANAELCLNRIWDGVKGRTLPQKVRAFAGVFLIVPAVMLPPMALTAALRKGSATRRFFDSFGAGPLLLKLLDVLPYVLLWVAFTLLYTRLPNTPVRKRSAVAGALVAGTLWQLAQVTYMSFVIAAVQYSAVYGTLWQLPILLVWLYVAWMIVLFGAEVSRAHHEVVEERRARVMESSSRPDDNGHVAGSETPQGEADGSSRY